MSKQAKNICHHSTSSNSVSSFSSSDDELDQIHERLIYLDELPTFDIRSISPTGRSPSPIDSEYLSEEAESPTYLNESDSNSNSKEHPQIHERGSERLISLNEINAQISSPVDQIENRSLETIYEGVFLETPPRKRDSLRIMATRAAAMCGNVFKLDLNVQDNVPTCKRVRKFLDTSNEIDLECENMV